MHSVPEEVTTVSYIYRVHMFSLLHAYRSNVVLVNNEKYTMTLKMKSAPDVTMIAEH